MVFGSAFGKYISNMKILQVKKFPIYDIFIGNGWLNWTRILIDKSKKVTIIAGEQLSMSEIGLTSTIPTLAKQSREHNQQVSNANKHTHS